MVPCSTEMDPLQMTSITHCSMICLKPGFQYFVHTHRYIQFHFTYIEFHFTLNAFIFMLNYIIRKLRFLISNRPAAWIERNPNLRNSRFLSSLCIVGICFATFWDIPKSYIGRNVCYPSVLPVWPNAVLAMFLCRLVRLSLIIQPSPEYSGII